MEVGIVGGRKGIEIMEMEGMKRGNVVSLIEWRRVNDNGVLCGGERIGSGFSAYGEGSNCHVNLKRFREIPRASDSEPNGRWGSEIHEKVENRSMAVDAAGAEKKECNRESMFEKAVTPSDVGKLNRLVIPKHHAEKYFPLDTSANDKGLLLTFEDNTGKTWRFRYSYWNSSQSYVLTKGWSRFVKEKKLDAGDIVSFERSTRDAQNTERLYISWKRRPPSTLQIQPGGAKASLLRRLSLPAPTFQYGALTLPLQFPLQSSQTLIRAASSVVWPHSNGGAAFWRLPKGEPSPVKEEPSPVTVSHSIQCLPAAERISVREPHDFMQLQASGDRSSPVENGGGELSSKKGVRLFGVNL